MTRRALYVGAFMPDETARHAGGQAAHQNRAELLRQGFDVTSLICSTERLDSPPVAGETVFRQSPLALLLGWLRNLLRGSTSGLLAWPLLDTRANGAFERRLRRELRQGGYELVFVDFTQTGLPVERALRGIPRRSQVWPGAHDIYVQKCCASRGGCRARSSRPSCVPSKVRCADTDHAVAERQRARHGALRLRRRRGQAVFGAALGNPRATRRGDDRLARGPLLRQLRPPRECRGADLVCPGRAGAGRAAISRLPADRRGCRQRHRPDPGGPSTHPPYRLRRGPQRDLLPLRPRRRAAGTRRRSKVQGARGPRRRRRRAGNGHRLRRHHADAARDRILRETPLPPASSNCWHDETLSPTSAHRLLVSARDRLRLRRRVRGHGQPAWLAHTEFRKLGAGRVQDRQGARHRLDDDGRHGTLGHAQDLDVRPVCLRPS